MYFDWDIEIFVAVTLILIALVINIATAPPENNGTCIEYENYTYMTYNVALKMPLRHRGTKCVRWEESE